MQNGKLRIMEDGSLGFYCPACQMWHYVTKNWTFNGSYEAPTFSPSVLVRTGHFIPSNQGECWCTYNKNHPEEPYPYECINCHSFVTDGKIEYLPDCTHAMAGQTVPLPDGPEQL